MTVHWATSGCLDQTLIWHQTGPSTNIRHWLICDCSDHLCRSLGFSLARSSRGVNASGSCKAVCQTCGLKSHDTGSSQKCDDFRLDLTKTKKRQHKPWYILCQFSVWVLYWVNFILFHINMWMKSNVQKVYGTAQLNRWAMLNSNSVMALSYQLFSSKWQTKQTYNLTWTLRVQCVQCRGFIGKLWK